MRSRSVLLFTALAALTLFLFLLDLAVGAVPVPLGDVWAALTGGDCPRATAKIILNIRLIKAVVALLAGAALSRGSGGSPGWGRRRSHTPPAAGPRWPSTPQRG